MEAMDERTAQHGLDDDVKVEVGVARLVDLQDSEGSDADIDSSRSYDSMRSFLTEDSGTMNDFVFAHVGRLGFNYRASVH